MTPSRVVERIDENALVTLRGNTHPLAQAQFDRGAAPADLPMARMLLVLKRSDGQEAAVQKLLDDQQDQSAPSYRQWLTPDQFGQQFGPSDQDIQTVASWLRSHGFQIGMIGRGRTVIEFSGTAAQVKEAFHTEIHKFTVNAEDRWANASDPQIPAALSPVIVGVASLHNFPMQPTNRVMGKFSWDKATGQVQALTPDFTIVDANQCSGTNNCYFVGPYDFAKIYNVSQLWNSSPPIDGTGESIAIVSESNINLQDVRDFRSLFGLPAKDPEIFLNGPDPGLVRGPEVEALLDVEWSGAVAKGATIKLVVSPPTNSTEGADLAGLYAVENNLAPIISESWGDCELYLGAAGNSFESAIRQQAAAQGITYINSSGDEGSARCDPGSAATHGLIVSGLASTPYGVAVGGTDFLNFGPNYDHKSPSPYWAASNANDSHHASALGYVPETVWNENCTNPVFSIVGWGATPEAVCNNPQLNSHWIQTIASGGGKSSCTSSDQTNSSSCTGGYPKPSWQVAPGIPADGARDIPDVSLFASAGFMDSAYILCEADELPTPVSCSLTTPRITFLGIGGTSAGAPSFAGIMALVNQYTHSAGQGNANYTMYRLASSSAQTSHACGATSSPSPACIFYDVTTGANSVPCWNGTTDCVTSTPGDSYGILPKYEAGAGYDQATGLGSVNAYNLVHAWNMPPNPSTVTLSLSPTSSTHGQSVNYAITVTPSSATGDVSLIGTPSPPASLGTDLATLQSGTATGTTTALAGGTNYSVVAHYAGDTSYAPSDSKPVKITVSPEPSKPVIWISTQFNPVVASNPTSVPYGTAIAGFVGVGGAQATATLPPQPPCAPLTCPTGSVTVSDSLNGGASNVLTIPGGYPLNIEGISQTFTLQPLGGQHVITASYAGDKSYLTGSGNYPLTVTPVFTAMSAQSSVVTVIAGSNATLTADVYTYLAGSGFTAIAPTGTITFTDGSAQIPGTVTYQSQGGFSPSIVGSISDTLTTTGTHQIAMSYSGDANYAPISSSTTVAVYYATTTTENTNSMTINDGQSVTVTAIATSATKSPAMTGTFQFNGSPFLNPVVVTNPVLSTDASGNQVLTAAATVTPQTYGSQTITANYFGDTNYQPGSANVNITVNPPDFTMPTSLGNLTITAGQTGTATVMLTPTTALQSLVSLSCNLFPMVGGQCTFNPTPFLNLSGGTAVSTMLSISTLPASSTTTTSYTPVRPEAKKIPPGAWLLILADGLAVLILSLWSGQKHRRLAASLGMACLLLLVVGCGSNGGGGGGGGGPVPTTLTLSTTAIRVASGGTVMMTATVNSSKSPTGTIILSEPGLTLATANLINGSAPIQLVNLPVGTHVISAQYSGDANNLPSQTGGSLSEVITGTVAVNVQASTGTLVHSAPLSVTIQ